MKVPFFCFVCVNCVVRGKKYVKGKSRSTGVRAVAAVPIQRNNLDLNLQIDILNSGFTFSRFEDGTSAKDSEQYILRRSRQDIDKTLHRDLEREIQPTLDKIVNHYIERMITFAASSEIEMIPWNKFSDPL